jgi:hypothetical protein
MIDVSCEIRCIEFLRSFFWNSEFLNWNSDFSIFSTAEFQKINLTGIFGIKNGIRIPLQLGVPEIGTKNCNSQPSTFYERDRERGRLARLWGMAVDCGGSPYLLGGARSHGFC